MEVKQCKAKQHIHCTCAMNDKVCDSNGITGNVLPSKLGGHCILLPEGPVLVLHVHSKHRRMMTHLERGEGSESGREGIGKEGEGRGEEGDLVTFRVKELHCSFTCTPTPTLHHVYTNQSTNIHISTCTTVFAPSIINAWEWVQSI